MPAAFIIGAGPGLGTSIARRFARADVPIGRIARSPGTVDATLSALADTLVDTYGVTADAADELALRAALDSLVDRLGVPDALVYNAAIIQSDTVDQLPMDAHLDAWAVNVVGALMAAASMAPAMARGVEAPSSSPAGCPSQSVSTSAFRSARPDYVPWWTCSTWSTAPPESTSRRHHRRPGRTGHSVRPRRHRRALLDPARQPPEHGAGRSSTPAGTSRVG